MSAITKFSQKLLVGGCVFFLWVSVGLAGGVKGIYISQPTLEDTRQITYLIQHAKAVGINTFVIDFYMMSNRYQKNIQLVKDNHIKYVARIVMFPGGGTDAQIHSQTLLEKRLKLIKEAVALGAQEIQLDYIRYSSKQPPSSQNAKNIHHVIKWYKAHLDQMHVPLQIDVFGIASFGESKYIGQNLKLFANTVDVMSPMVYPSHFEPYKVHAVKPYETIYTALSALHRQLDNNLPFRLIPFIELSNYRYPLSHAQKLAYIRAQIKATEDMNTSGWYAWSAANYYDNLFIVLQHKKAVQQQTSSSL